MANTQYYCITKKGKSGDIVYFDYEKLSGGYDIKPRNSFSYEGIKVNKLILKKKKKTLGSSSSRRHLAPF